MSYSQIKKLDDILFKITVNVPKNLTKQDLNRNPLFLHNYDKIIIEKAKKYVLFEDININKIDEDKLNKLLLKNVNYPVQQFLNLPKNKFTFVGEFKIKYIDFYKYKLTIYENFEMQISHFDFGNWDYVKILPFFNTKLCFAYYESLKQFENQLTIFEENDNYINITSLENQKFFGYSIKPNLIHYSKNLSKYSKQSCIFCSYDLELSKPVEIEFYLSNYKQDFVEFEMLLSRQKNKIVVQ